jgi:hypothetical protein
MSGRAAAVGAVLVIRRGIHDEVAVECRRVTFVVNER